ncbi:MAG TPA: hypothetical protein DCY07_04950 [Rhodospirillaceae bacterium]|nr:hypothetical protein [Rhodospirillaceae bacterium]
MSLSIRSSISLTALGFALAFAAFSPSSVMAQVPVSSTETYQGQTTAVTPETGVLPDGMTWNTPLKAGDMVLPRKAKPKEKATAPLVAPRVSGALKAPLMSATASNTKATAPQISAEQGSTASIMMLQGMKSALQKSGQNTDIPKSDMEAIDPTAPKSAESLPPITFNGQTPAALAVPLKDKDAAFVAGQEPKGWVSPDGADALKSGSTDIVFPPEMAKEAAAGVSAEPMADDSTKATELSAEPKPLEAVAEDKGFFDRVSEPFSSIFGEPVDEKAEAAAKAAPQKESAVSAAADAEPAPVSAFDRAQELIAKSAKPCEPSVVKWTRECGDSGYPAHFVGQIVGETRVTCPSGDARDVWLSNSCAAPIANASVAVQGQTATAIPAVTDMAQEPISASALKSAPETGAVVVPDLAVSVDASCGASNGLAADGKPAGDLCSQGEATSVLGEGPWRWSCKGRNGGMTVSCAAPVASAAAKKDVKSTGITADPMSAVVEDGVCGTAAGEGTQSEPVTALCAKGTPSRVNGSGPWTWACSGLNGGMAASCTAPLKADGLCGKAHEKGSDSMPLRDLCTAGFASAVTGEGPWNWTCSGLHGGGAASCVAPLKQNAVCGDASTRGHRETPSQNLCSVGDPTIVEGNGPWTWSCEGGSGGASVPCKATRLLDGVCGIAHGSMYDKAPNEGLCTAGNPTRVTGMGPFDWSCSGDNGGVTVSCTAALGTKEQVAAVTGCGEAAEALALSKPSEKLCASGTASDVTGVGPWKWSCSDDAGHVTQCTTLSPTAGACGKAAGASSATEPKADLCEKGSAGEVLMDAKTNWKWTCNGSLGEASASCTAPIATGAAAKETLSKASAVTPKPVVEAKPDALCGSASGQNFAEKPTSGLCEAGKASAVKLNKSWTWTCSGKKAKANCDAMMTVSGSCGGANGSVRKEAPTSGLCASGTPSVVSGEGPWLWSCIGSGNGGSASCSASTQAQTRVDGSCGEAAAGLAKEMPDTKLCDTGMPSAVYGEGPWTWTCSGLNGGIASSCTAAATVPQAPPPPGPLVNGVCGSSSGMAANAAPETGLCTSGIATALSGEGPWNWGCLGSNGGMTVSCTAPLTPPSPIVGMCGAASGVPTLTSPKGALCAAGISSAVSGKGPWTWSCSGTNGGGAVSCVAPLAGKGASTQSIPSMTTPSKEPAPSKKASPDEAPAPKAAPLGLVTPQLSSKALPAMKPGTVPDLKLSKKVENKPEASALPAAKLETASEVPDDVPELPPELKPLNPPPERDSVLPPPGLKPPVIDSEGKPVPGTRLVLDSDVSSISFDRGSDKLDSDAVEIVEQLVVIMKKSGGARITLVAYSDTDGTISPREARRISLNRALAIRDFMTTKGIASSRVDVRPMGANVPSGDMDRVDVKVN